MHLVVCYLVLFILTGGIGMAIANGRVTSEVRRGRWIKFFTYIIIAGIVILAISYNFFTWFSIVLVLLSFAELTKVNSSVSFRPLPGIIFSFFVLTVIAAGFIFFGKTFSSSFLLFIYLQVLIFDAFCQISGQLLGRHKLMPRISAAKTTEGLVGGWSMCMVCAVLTSGLINAGWTKSLFFGFLTAVTSFCGDTIASAYKRKISVKDYSNWLPGQGGFLDRFDSFLMTGAVYYAIMQLAYNGYYSVHNL